MGYILCLAGGRWQYPWIYFLKNKGHKIILVDPTDNPFCADIVDHILRYDVKDTQAILNELKERKFVVDKVFSDQTDVTKIPEAKINFALGLVAEPLEVVELFCDKVACKNFIRSNKIGHIPEYTIARHAEDVLKFREKFDTKLIVKPSDSQSSRGIFIVDQNSTEADIKKRFKESLHFSTNGTCIIEQFVEGTEITLEGIVVDGIHKTLSGSIKKHFRTGIASDLIFPIPADKPWLNAVIEYHNNLIQKTGIKNSITHTEYIVNEETNDFYLIETACRGGGSLIPSDIVPWVSGYPIYDIIYNSVILENVDIEQPNRFPWSDQKHAILHFFEFSSGTVTKIIGLSECKEHKYVHTISLEFEVGDTIGVAEDDRSRQGFVIILGNTENDITDTLQYIDETLLIEVE